MSRTPLHQRRFPVLVNDDNLVLTLDAVAEITSSSPDDIYALLVVPLIAPAILARDTATSPYQRHSATEELSILLEQTPPPPYCEGESIYES